MEMREFLTDNREEIDAAIRTVDSQGPRDDRERELWIANDESLYAWAIDEGVDV